MQQIGDVIKSTGRVNPCNFGGDASVDVSNILLLSHLSLPVHNGLRPYVGLSLERMESNFNDVS